MVLLVPVLGNIVVAITKFVHFATNRKPSSSDSIPAENNRSEDSGRQQLLTSITEVRQGALSIPGLRDASEELKNDREVVLAAIGKQPYALRHASNNLKNNEEIVRAAISKDGRTLQYASETLRNNEEIVRLAVQNHGAAFQYASETLRDNIEIARLAMAHDGREWVIESASDNVVLELEREP